MNLQTTKTDILILGSGGAGLFAALHAQQARSKYEITIAVKGLLGKCGCTRMVQGGYNVALSANDSIERHFMDTIEGGKWLNHQELAWCLVNSAVTCIHELENQLGCFFDRNPDGTVHQKAFAGQTFDRTVHKGDLTGIEIINRLSEKVLSNGVRCLQEYRAVALIPSKDGERMSGVLFIDMRSGEFVFVQAKAVLLATGGGPTMYRYHTPSGDKSCDGMAMALRLGLGLRDMEMVQFHPTGLAAGNETRITGTIIEEGLRGVGGHLMDVNEQRFMHAYDERGERATRDIVSRAMFDQMQKGQTGANGGVFLSMRHLDEKMVRQQFKGMVERCADVGFDLVNGLVEVTPTAHYMMGGVEFDAQCHTGLPGLFAAGEDTGGVHGANRLGGNGVANSTVFGGIAGTRMAEWLDREGAWVAADEAHVDETLAQCLRPFHNQGGNLNDIRERLLSTMWDNVGIIRNREGLERGEAVLWELADQLDHTSVADSTRAYNLAWQEWLNLNNQIMVSLAINRASLTREESRGAHYRSDYPNTDPLENSVYTRVSYTDDGFDVRLQPVEFSRVRPGESLL